MRAPVCFVVLFAAACGTDASVSGVFPAEGFTGRSLRVEISGDATQWSGTPTLNMGDGVTVSRVSVASPTTLFADITIAADATPGLRDVTVIGDGTLTLDQAFELVPPIELSFAGLVAQGGAPYFTVTNHDFETPFDVTNVTLETPLGTSFVISSASPFQLSGYALIDTDATPGPFSLSSGQDLFDLGANIDIKPRTPVPLADGATGMLPSKGDSVLYSVDVAAVPALVRITATTSSMNGQPIGALLRNGSWTGAASARLSVQPSAGTFDVVMFDAGVAGGYSFSVRDQIEQLATAPEASGINDTAQSALAASALPFAEIGGTLSAGDKDWIKVTLAAPAILHVHAFADDDSTDTAVDILGSGAGNPSVLTNYMTKPVDDGQCFPLFGLACGEDVTSPMLAAGTYYVVVTTGGSFKATANMYSALVYLN